MKLYTVIVILSSILFFVLIMLFVLFSCVCSPQTLVRALRYVADRLLHFPLKKFYFSFLSLYLYLNGLLYNWNF